jgi:hypothetical protein
MGPSWSRMAVLSVADHEIVAFYNVDDVDMIRGPGTTFGHLVAKGDAFPLPADQREALRGRYASEPVWRQAEPDEAGKTAFKMGEDLHPHLRAILSGSQTDLATRWLPTEATIALLASADLYEAEKLPGDRTRKVMVLKYTKAAERRLNASGSVPRVLKLTIEALDLTLFNTRKGLLQVRLAVSPLEEDRQVTAIELLEAVCSLSRFNSLQWASLTPGHPIVSIEFGLGPLMRGLSFEDAGPMRASDRIFSYLLAQFASPVDVDEADLFALHAARHYTVDYNVTLTTERRGRVRDFATVGHTLALEGGATIIAPTAESELPDFLKNWKTNVHRAYYMPIVALALHEHEFLVDKTSAALLSPSQRANPEESRKALMHLTQASLNFRIFFRYTEVSEITMHNAFNRALRDVLGLDRMQAKFTGDVREITDFLQRQNFLARLDLDRERLKVEHRRNSRFWLLGVIGTGILTALSVGALSKQILESRKMFLVAWEHPVATLYDPEGSGFVALMAGLVSLIIVCIAGYLKRPLEGSLPRASENGRFAEEAAIEMVVRQTHEGNPPLH